MESSFDALGAAAEIASSSRPSLERAEDLAALLLLQGLELLGHRGGDRAQRLLLSQDLGGSLYGEDPTVAA